MSSTEQQCWEICQGDATRSREKYRLDLQNEDTYLKGMVGKLGHALHINFASHIASMNTNLRIIGSKKNYSSDFSWEEMKK